MHGRAQAGTDELHDCRTNVPFAMEPHNGVSGQRWTFSGVRRLKRLLPEVTSDYQMVLISDERIRPSRLSTGTP